MMSTEGQGSGWVTFAKVLGAVAALLTAVGGLLATLDATGVIGSESDSVPPTPVTQLESSTLATPAPTPLAPVTVAEARGDVIIRYRGEQGPANCVLYPTVSIGDRSAQPSELQPLIADVGLGSQSYTISGGVDCFDVFGNVTSCRAEGSGDIEVVDGADYYLVWSFPTDQFLVCPFALSPN